MNKMAYFMQCHPEIMLVSKLFSQKNKNKASSTGNT